MLASIILSNSTNFVTIQIEAIELPEKKLECEFLCESAVFSPSGKIYKIDLLRILCLDGMRIARRKLSLPNGLKIVVYKISGEIEIKNEICICYATELSIAKSLSKDIDLPISNMPDWCVNI